MLTMQAKSQPPDLPPHLKMLSKPTPAADAAQGDDTNHVNDQENLTKADGEDCELITNNGQENACEDMEALLPEEYRDRAEGEVSSSIQVIKAKSL